MRKFLLKLKIKGCETIFREELGPGVIAWQEVGFDREPYEGAIAAALLEQEALFLQDVLEVQIEEICYQLEGDDGGGQTGRNLENHGAN